MVSTALTWAEELGCRHMYLSTFDILKTARKMYSSLGFVKTAQEPADYVAPGLTEEIWEKDF